MNVFSFFVILAILSGTIGFLVARGGPKNAAARTTCDTGYTFGTDGTACVENKCECQNGIGTKGSNCPEDGAHKCDHCDIHYNLNGFTCDPNQCECQHGIEATGSECPKHGLSKCESCNGGGFLRDISFFGGTQSLSPTGCNFWRYLVIFRVLNMLKIAFFDFRITPLIHIPLLVFLLSFRSWAKNVLFACPWSMSLQTEISWTCMFVPEPKNLT